jgi:hypothetical protein
MERPLCRDTSVRLHFVDDRLQTLQAVADQSDLKRWKLHFADWCARHLANNAARVTLAVISMSADVCLVNADPDERSTTLIIHWTRYELDACCIRFMHPSSASCTLVYSPRSLSTHMHMPFGFSTYSLASLPKLGRQLQLQAIEV